MRVFLMIIEIVLVGLFCLECASSKRTVDERGGEIKYGEINEDFDPLSLDEPELVIQPVERPTVTNEALPSYIYSSDADSAATLQEVSGYRVQIGATPDEETAREIRKEAILKFDEPVYLRFDPPFYKIRVGDCVSRFEAEDLQELAIERGFDEAWVIQTMVTPRREEPSAPKVP